MLPSVPQVTKLLPHRPKKGTLDESALLFILLRDLERALSMHMPLFSTVGVSTTQDNIG